MARIFETTAINNLELQNRFVRSATATSMASEEGAMTPKLQDLYLDVARGGVGLLLSDYAYVLKDGQSFPRQLGIYDNELVSGLKQMVDAVHNAGGKIVAQINHGGAHSDPRFTGVEPMGPSAIPASEGKVAPFPGCRAMLENDIDTVVEGYKKAAVRAKKAGFDGIQLHGAHGYLFSQFLSPFYNKRTDKYGGDVASRARIVVDTYHQVRNNLGNDYPILIKMNVTDFLDGGISTDEAIQAATIYEEMGIDAIELSGGTTWGLYVLGDINRTPFRSVQNEAYYLDIAKRMKSELGVPIILTGGIRSYDTAEQLLANGTADYIGLCRPLIREPDLINRWKSGNTNKSGCMSDNGCAFAALEGKGLHCVKL